MILIIIFILMALVGIMLLCMTEHFDIPVEPIIICTAGGACGFFLSAVALVGVSQSLYIEGKISDYKIERLGVEQNYIESLNSHDKHQRLSALAKITAWNADVESYKDKSQNPVIGDFYPDEVANSLEYIDMSELEE